jgi:hypothetical protein
MLKHPRRGLFAALFVIITLHASGHIKYAVWWMTRDSVLVFCWAAGEECERLQCFHKFQVTLCESNITTELRLGGNGSLPGVRLVNSSCMFDDAMTRLRPECGRLSMMMIH